MFQVVAKNTSQIEGFTKDKIYTVRKVIKSKSLYVAAEFLVCNDKNEWLWRNANCFKEIEKN